MNYLGQVQDLSWVSPSRIFATEVELFNSQPNYEHEVARALDTGAMYQGIENRVGGWGLSNGDPSTLVPFPVPAVNDQFTKLLLEFDGIEGSTTYYDTNASGRPRKWRQVCGLGHITNVGEKFYSGALFLDGQTVIIAQDEGDFFFGTAPFTIRGYFLCDFPLGIERVLVAKSDRKGMFVYWAKRTSAGRFNMGVDAPVSVDNTIVDRSNTTVVDRVGENIFTRFGGGSTGRFELESTTLYADDLNPGWHEFKLARSGSILTLTMDGVVEATADMQFSAVLGRVGPFTIGGNGPRVSGNFDGVPWIGGLDRFAIDIGVGR